MKVIFLESGKKAQVIEIEKELEQMQKLVGGYIEAIYPFEDEEVALVCNEEGKITGLHPNRVIYDTDGIISDIIYGDFFICSAPFNSESFESLSEDQISKYYTMFEKPDFSCIDNQHPTIKENEKTKKYELNFNYSENTIFAIEIAKEISENLNNGEYDDLDTAIMQELDNKLIYYADQWELLKAYQTPQTANYDEAIEMLISELYSIISEEIIDINFEETELEER